MDNGWVARLCLGHAEHRAHRLMGVVFDGRQLFVQLDPDYLPYPDEYPDYEHFAGADAPEEW